MRIKLFFFSTVLVSLLMALLASTAFARDNRQNNLPDSPVVAQIYFADRSDLNRLAARLDVWEVKPEGGYLIAMLSPQQYQDLLQAGYHIEIDQARTALINQPRIPLPGQGSDSIPGYPCYRTVEETYTDMSALAANHPDMATWIDIGDSWDKIHSGGGPGYDIYALKLTNSAIPGTKPTFFLMAEIHAREYVTAETAARFAEYLVDNYGIDPDITWLLDYYQVYIVTMTNPDGRKMAEAGDLWRKNIDNDDGCNDQYSWGTDLNRNHSFKWNNGGSSPFPCDETYMGPSAGSEPEVQAIQNFVLTLFPDQRGPGDYDQAPPDTTGTFVTLHSAAGLVLWPWGWTSNPSPNGTQLQTLGRKLAYFNGYTPQQSYQLYQTSGTSDEWAYGVLGIAGYTYEMGTDFFQDCNSYESTIYPTNRDSLMMAFKSARLPYMEPSGPEALNVAAIPGGANPGDAVMLNATVDDTRFNNSSGTEPTQNIAAAEYYIDTPPWITDTTPIPYPMSAVDGAFDEKIEAVTATLDTTGLAQGRHILFVRGQDVNGNWGVVSATFLYILEPGVSPTVQGYVRDASTNQPLVAIVHAGMFQGITNPETGFYSMTVISGTYDLVAEADSHAPVTVSGVQAQNYQTVSQDFYLSPVCSILADDVENGNIGWTAQSPWAITAESSHSPTHSWTDSPGGNYGNYRNISLTSPSLNLTGYTGVALDFWHIYDMESGWDFGYVEYSPNGSTWTAVATYSGYGHTTWEQQSFPLPGLDGQSNARIRFRFTSDSNTVADGWHIDDISLVGGGAACTTPLAPTAEFTSSATTVSPGEPIQFTDLTYGTPPFTYQWDFGDGNTSDQANPVHAYMAVDIYTVTLTVTNALGTDSVSHPILVQEGICVPLTGVDLNLLNTQPLRPEDIAHFQADLLPAYFTRPVTYTLDYGDGTPPVNGSSSAGSLIFDHSFTDVGDYPVTIGAWNCTMTIPVTSTAMTSVISYTADLEVSPLAQFGSGYPGEAVTYTLIVTNTGEQPDNYNLSLIDAGWQTELPASLGPLAAGASASVIVTVTVDAGAPAGASDTAVVQVASSHPTLEPVTATITTSAKPVYGLGLEAVTGDSDGFPLMPVTYTLRITNTGNTTDTFEIEVDSLWPASAVTTTEPLASGAGMDLTVVVVIPAAVPVDGTDTVTVAIHSMGDPEVHGTVAWITTARWKGVWLPVVMR